MKDENGNSVSLREYVERIFQERQSALALAFQGQKEAMVVRERVLEDRLAKLNELREEVTRDRGIYISREIVDQRLGVLDMKLRVLDKRLAWLFGVGSLLLIIVGFLGTIIGWFIGK